jgi:hypothetical protein
MMFRHGDVLILDAQPLPSNAKRRDSNIVAEGEVTGHAHRLNNGEVWDDGDGGLMVVCADDAHLTHEEHNRLDLPVTKHGEAFPIIIQREYDDENEWRQVAD